MAVSRDGRRLYMPDGELTRDGTWYVLDAASGQERGRIEGCAGPHNTIVSLNGRHVYLGGRNGNYLEVADTRTGRIVRRIGPLQSGVRPFTITGKETLAYTTATGFLGFQVSNIRSGRVLYTVPIHGFSWDPAHAPSAPSHGISLSPNEKEIYVMDSPNSEVHVFDVSRVPASAPRQVTNIALTKPMTGNESPCSYDCARDGWLQHSRDGRYVYVGDSGDVIDTRTRKVVEFLAPLYSTRKYLEIDFRGSVPVFSTSRSGLGYVTR
jgi:DNA-binding beta-propeller fold protein YncE